jgi:hypothetical protein
MASGVAHRVLFAFHSGSRAFHEGTGADARRAPRGAVCADAHGPIAGRGGAAIDRLIEAHPNIYFLTSRSDPLIIRQAGQGRQPWVNMFQGSGLADDWNRLMVRYPERFALAFDNVWPEYWSDLYVERARLWRHALIKLPASVARAIAHGNAERLWNIPRDP